MKLKTLEVLGSGGFGVVERVENETGQQFARKTFSINHPLPDALIPNVRKRFVREAKLQSGMDHRNIVPILHVSLTGDTPWYLMPVADSTLERDLAADNSIGGQYRLALSDIIAGLEELHSMQMYHRDLKPQNVLRFSDGVKGKPYYAIGDFGFVSLKDSTLSKLTHTGMAKGTDYYTAPEITKDLRNASPQSDIYSVGCILHDMVGTEDRVPCGEVRETGDFSAVLLNCTRLKPDRRFKTASSIRDVLLSIDAHAPTARDQDAISLVDRMDSDDDLTANELHRLAEFLEDNLDTTDAVILLRKLSLEHIRNAWSVHPAHAKRVGIVFAEWVADNAFDFDYCDVLANRVEAFIASGDYDLKAECLRALLKMGTSHNRWYVERKFFVACGSDMEEGLAKRLAVEFRAGGRDVCEQIEHLEHSISVERGSFHPTLAQALNESCL